MINLILGKILTNKWTIAVAALLILVLIGWYIHLTAFNSGYKQGVATTTAEYNAEKLKWIDKVSKMQQSYEDTMNGILTSYNGQIADYEQQIDILDSKDPIIKTRYIHKYVPVEVNCTIPKGFVDLHNTAAQGKTLSDNPINAMGNTTISLQDVGSTVAINYYQYNKISAQLKALQEVIRQFQIKQKELIR